jgi:hypothetical protein
MVRHGHQLTIYSYAPTPSLSAALGAELLDARDIAPENGLAHRYRHVGRFQMFANLFRLELQRQEKGTWVDLDCYFLKPLTTQSDYVFGLMSPNKLNNAVLRLPSQCPMLPAYIQAITADPLRTPWSSFAVRLRRDIEILFGKSQPGALVRTNIGPRALSYFAKKYDVLKYAVPPDTFYPIGNKETHVLAHPNRELAEEKLSERTVLIHLWRGKMKRLGLLTKPPPASSFLGLACSKMGLAS